MKLTPCQPVASSMVAALIVTAHCAFGADVAGTSSGEFAPLGAQVIEYLQLGDAEKLEKAITPTLDDWRAACSTNKLTNGADPLQASFRAGVAQTALQIKVAVDRLIEKAHEVGLVPGQVQFRVKEIIAPRRGAYRTPAIHGEKDSMPMLSRIEVVLDGEPAAGAPERVRGEYRLALSGLLLFPSGWRCHDGLSWKAFPPAMMDEKTRQEMAILDKIATRKDLTLADDPALQTLGEALMRFIRQKDERIFVSEALRTVDEAWAEFDRQMPKDQPGRPKREDVERAINDRQAKQIKSANAMLSDLKSLGIDLRDAEIRLKDAVAEYPSTRGAGKVDGTSCQQLRFTYEVQSKSASKAGKSLSGEYTIAASRGERFGGRWFIGNDVRWQKLPDGVADPLAVRRLEFENYVAEYGTLPPGTAAPDVELVRIDNQAKTKLSDYRGKIVVLEFWATWCGPCQEPMAKMQTVIEHHPEWKDQVEIISLSIDDTLEPARTHLNKKGWTNTFNTWAGAGVWDAAPSKAFRVNLIPVLYVISAEGKVIQAGHPVGVSLEQVVKSSLP